MNEEKQADQAPRKKSFDKLNKIPFNILLESFFILLADRYIYFAIENYPVPVNN